MEGLLPAVFGACLAISFLLSGMEAGLLALTAHASFWSVSD